MGEFLKQMPKATGGERGGRAPIDGDRAEPSNTPPTLAEIGITKKQSSTAQKLADIPEPEFLQGESIFSRHTACQDTFLREVGRVALNSDTPAGVVSRNVRTRNQNWAGRVRAAKAGARSRASVQSGCARPSSVNMMKTHEVTLHPTTARLSSFKPAKRSESIDQRSPGALCLDRGEDLRVMPKTPQLQAQLVDVGGKIRHDVYVLARAAADLDGSSWDRWLTVAIRNEALAAIEYGIRET